jgi:hypothetical protein
LYNFLIGKYILSDENYINYRKKISNFTIVKKSLSNLNIKNREIMNKQKRGYKEDWLQDPSQTLPVQSPVNIIMRYLVTTYAHLSVGFK